MNNGSIVIPLLMISLAFAVKALRLWLGEPLDGDLINKIYCVALPSIMGAFSAWVMISLCEHFEWWQ